MKNYRPGRAILYLTFARILLTLAILQGSILAMMFCFEGHEKAMDTLPLHSLILGAAVFVAIWVAEWFFFFVRKARLSADEKGFTLVNGEVNVGAEWSSVKAVWIRHLELSIELAGQRFGMPLLSHDEQWEIYRKWFQVSGLSPSRDVHLKSVRATGRARRRREVPRP